MPSSVNFPDPVTMDKPTADKTKGSRTLSWSKAGANPDGTPKNCTQAKKPDGTYRFVDGLSISLKFSTLPVKIGSLDPPPAG